MACAFHRDNMLNEQNSPFSSSSFSLCQNESNCKTILLRGEPEFGNGLLYCEKEIKVKTCYYFIDDCFENYSTVETVACFPFFIFLLSINMGKTNEVVLVPEWITIIFFQRIFPVKFIIYDNAVDWIPIGSHFSKTHNKNKMYDVIDIHTCLYRLSLVCEI